MNIVLATHGHLGEELVRSAGMIFGDMNVPCVSLLPGMSFEEFTAKAEELLSSLEGDTIVLVDLFGGTPSNVFSALSRKYGHDVITGVNLPVLIDLYTKVSAGGELDKEQLVKETLETLRESGVHTNELLNK